MPIYSYRPRTAQDIAGEHDSGLSDVGYGAEGRECCTFDYLHLPGTPDSKPWQYCPTCQRPVERRPSSFAAKTQAPSATAQALRRSGQSNFAEAWEQTERTLGGAQPKREGTRADAAPPAESGAGRALKLADGHVCTASCRHGLGASE